LDQGQDEACERNIAMQFVVAKVRSSSAQDFGGTRRERGGFRGRHRPDTPNRAVIVSGANGTPSRSSRTPPKVLGALERA
jgi:hypothetical protein